ncbi:TetR/AcrR family transcriptional regulator [Desulfogranum mediterraneum]|uniref:TetR/AcrR family transcriptional regulator n=1 Tax=Desulfogranum mediterraneum TaxID=160661 RepID=UPI0004157A5E|nr:TetR/AcrR family transcriptional regulator [Desulfogranum mediterraneum]
MPPNQKFTRDEIVEAALSIVRDQGWEKLTQRSVAKKMNASIGPIYSYFKSMSSLERAVIKKAYELLLHYMMNARTKEGEEIPGIGYVQFAKNEKKLFKCFFYEKHTEIHKEYAQHLWQTLREEKKNDPVYSKLSEHQKDELNLNSIIFCYGLAILINISFYDEFTDEDISTLILNNKRMFLKGIKEGAD